VQTRDGWVGGCASLRQRLAPLGFGSFSRHTSRAKTKRGLARVGTRNATRTAACWGCLLELPTGAARQCCMLVLLSGVFALWTGLLELVYSS